MANEPAPSISVVIGQNLQRIREDRGQSQDEVARDLRLAGLQWSRSTVAMAEAGLKTYELGETMALALALCDDGKVGELLKGDGQVVVGDLLVSMDEARSTLNDAKGGTGAAVTRLQARHSALAGIQMNDVLSRSGLAAAATGEAEQKAARSLGIPIEDVNLRAVHLWGRSLTQERDRRLANRSTETMSRRSTQAARGHITRELLRELEKEAG